MRVSIIIPTYNGAHKIKNILNALKNQSYKNFEVIVVIDGSTDETANVIKTCEVNFDIKVLERPNGGRSVARNTGAKEAKGDLLIFFDDDIRPINDCIKLHIIHHQTYPGTAMVGNVPEDLSRSHTDFQQYKAFLSRKWIAPLIANGGWLSKENIFLTAANFSIDRNLFWELNGFDERLRDIEDYELGLRISEKMIPVFFHGEAIGWHDDFVTCKSYIKRQREYSKAIDKLLKLMAFEKRRAEALEANQSKWKKYIYSLFCHHLLVYIIDHVNIFQFFLPRKARYQLYDIVTWGLARYYPERKI